LELGWELVKVGVGQTPSGDLGSHTTWVFLGGNWDDSKIWVGNIDFRSEGDDGVIVIHTVGVPVWMAGEHTVNLVFWLVSHDGSHNNLSSGGLFAVAGRHDESSGDEGSTAEVGARVLEGHLPWGN